MSKNFRLYFRLIFNQCWLFLTHGRCMDTHHHNHNHHYHNHNHNHNHYHRKIPNNHRVQMDQTELKSKRQLWQFDDNNRQPILNKNISNNVLVKSL